MTQLSSLLFSPVYFATACIRATFGFAWLWLKSRRFVRILAGLPAIALAAAFAWAILKSSLLNSRAERLERYLAEARAAVAESDVRSARLLFRRAEQVDPGNLDLKLEFATTLYHGGERSEAFQMLLTIAPIRKTGHLPAHRFLAEHPPEGPKANQDAFRAIHLSHLVRTSTATRAERNQLLQLLATYKRFSDAEALIQSSLKEHPEDRLLLAQLKSASGDSNAARREATMACDDLAERLQTNPGQHEIRVSLAQAQVMIGRFSEAVTTLCDGIQLTPRDSQESSKFQTTIVRTYLGWLSTLPMETQIVQRRCLYFMMKEMPSAATSDLFAPSFESSLTEYMQSENGRWMVPAIHGNALATSGDLSAAETRFREALESKPNDPVIANNLAWVILQSAQDRKDRGNAAARLEEALALCQIATSRMPDIASFHETRAQVCLALERPDEALADFRKCQELGMSTEAIEAAIQRLENRGSASE